MAKKTRIKAKEKKGVVTVKALANRITSYNVCYTKLLRTSCSKEYPCNKYHGINNKNPK